MSHSELTRLEILQRIEDRRLSQAQAATMLGLTDRQMRRLVRCYRAHGPEGLVSKKRGMRGNHRRPESFREHVLGIIRERYVDFGPTLAREAPRAPWAPGAIRDAAWLDEGSRDLAAAVSKATSRPAASSQASVFRPADPGRRIRTSLV